MGVKLNRQQLADLLGKSPKWVGELIKRGLPTEGGGGRGVQLTIDSAKALNCMIDSEVARQVGDVLDETKPKPGTMEGETLLLTQARRRSATVEADRAEETVIDREAVAQFFYEVATVYASELDGLGARVASELATIHDPATIKHVLFAECRRIRGATAQRLMAFAAADPDGGDPDSGCQAAEDASRLGE